jgi:hypothetical protein
MTLVHRQQRAWRGVLLCIDAASPASPPSVAQGHHVKQMPTGKGDALPGRGESASSDTIVMIDADDSTDSVEIPRDVGAIIPGVDFAKGARFTPRRIQCAERRYGLLGALRNHQQIPREGSEQAAGARSSAI